MSDNDRAPSATEGPPAGDGHRELIEDAAESHAAAQSLVALLLGDLERSERYKVELLERVSSAERRAAEVRGHYDAVREQVIVLARELAEARAEASELRSALVHWGEHRLDCAYRAKYANRSMPPECDCGLAVALADAPEAGAQAARGAEVTDGE